MICNTPAGLEADGISTSHPLTVGRPAKKLSEFDNWFDDISYAKGGAVMRMLRAWLNHADAPMLGLSSNGTADALQHARHRRSRRLQQTLSEYLKDDESEDSDGISSSDQSSGTSWWLQKVRVGSNTKLPEGQESMEQGRPLARLPTLEPAAEMSAEGDSSNNTAELNSSGSDSNGSYAGSGSSVNWWTKKSHFGGGTADLAQQVKGQGAGSVAGSSPMVAPAAANAISSAVTETQGYEGLASQDPFIRGLQTYLQVRFARVNRGVCVCQCVFA